MFRRKPFLCSICIGLFLLMMSGMAHGTLAIIGAVYYDGAFYGMIYDEDQNLVWLDYTNAAGTWQSQMDWASSLNTEGTLRYAYFEKYVDLTWTGEWRLPSAGDYPEDGFYRTTSEMGHLFYEGLGLLGGGSLSDDELNATIFDNLIASWYWTGTESAYSTYDAWNFCMDDGYQYRYYDKVQNGYGLAVRTGQVSVVPIPGAALLLSTGVVGLAVAGRRRDRDV